MSGGKDNDQPGDDETPQEEEEQEEAGDGEQDPEPAQDETAQDDEAGDTQKEEDEQDPQATEEQSQEEQMETESKEESPPQRRSKRSRVAKDEDDEDDLDLDIVVKEPEILDPKVAGEMEYIKVTEPTTRLELALTDALKRKESHIERLSGEVQKLKAFISKRKQTYKRKRKDEGAPTRALSAYNIFVQDRFAQLAKENEAALKSADTDVQLKRVPPANLVASTGNQWKELPPEEKQKYEERAKADRKRYEEQMAQYQPPDKQANRKRNKTGYNMFFSAHVLRLKQSEMGVPSERGSVARLVGTAWKQLSSEEKQYYEREADKHNGMNPVEKDGEDEDDDDGGKRQPPVPDPYAHMHAGHEMHMHAGMPPPMHGGMHQPPQHDPRHHGYAYPPHHMYGQPHGYYDYSQHHSQSRHQHSRSQYAQGYPPQRHPYDQNMPM